MAVTWTKDLSVGISEIDNQHKELFVRLNSLYDAMKQRKGKAETAKVIKFLEDYVVSHFGAEEKYMDLYSYKSMGLHKAQHTGFIREFANIKKSLSSGEISTTTVIQTQKQITEWLTNHIGKTDKAFGEFLSTKLN